MTGSLARRVVFAGAVLAMLALALVAPAFVLAGAPALALAMGLLAGWFPGETVVARLRDRRAGRRKPCGKPARVLAGVRITRRASRLLICFSLANRPPPLLLNA